MPHSTPPRTRVNLALTCVTALLFSGLTVLAATAAPPTADMARLVAPAASKSYARAARGKPRWVRVYNRAHRPMAAGTVLRATTRIKATRRPTQARIRVIRMVNGHRTASRTVSLRAPARSWRHVAVTMSGSTKASRVQVWVKRQKTLRVGAVHVAQVRRTRPSAAPVYTAPPAQPSGWKLDLSEEFNSLDRNRWRVKDQDYSSNEDSYLLAGNTTVRNGALRIQGKPQAAGGRKYTSGYIQSNGKYSVPNYFRAEVRAKLPFEQGMWPAPLWFRPENGSDGEIDLVETLGSERAKPAVTQTIHTEYGANHKQLAFYTLFSSFSTAKATDWHTYTMEKVPGRMTMWVDGVKTAVFTASTPSWYSKYYEVAGRRWNLRVNLQIGGDWGGLPDATTNWSGDRTTMQVDYIRTWVPK